MSLPVPAEDPAEASAHDLTDVVDRPLLRVSGPAEIVEPTPYVLGLHPLHTLLLIALRGRRIVASARNDLDAPLDLVRPWCGAVSRAGADTVVAALYCDDVHGTPLPRLGYVAELEALLQEHALRIVDILAVSNERWWSYHCTVPACCPPQGTPVERSGAIAAAAVTAGLVALPGRDDLRVELAFDERAIAEVAAAAERLDPLSAAAGWGRVRRLVKRARSGRRVNAPVAAGVLVALSDKQVRDATFGYLVAPPDPAVRDLWRRLTAMAPPDLRAAPATLYAMWCYAAGEGARANVGIDTALDADPDYTMAHLLLEVQLTGLNPFEVVHDMAVAAAAVGRGIRPDRSAARRAGARRRS